MAGHGVPYPSVFVVDSNAAYPPPPVPPKPSPAWRGAGVAQTLLFVLVSLALCGMAIEACLIYRLYYPDASEMNSRASKSVQDKPDIGSPATTIRPNPVVLPSKPVAHLNLNGEPLVAHAGVLQWDMQADPLCHQMECKDGKLVIQKEGYYYIYSKLHFKESNSHFIHSVVRSTPRYLGPTIPLLRSRDVYPKSGKMSISNSYLGGVLHLFEGDSIHVVSNGSHVIRAQANDNCFGAFMI